VKGQSWQRVEAKIALELVLVVAVIVMFMAAALVISETSAAIADPTTQAPR
jgi:hypothetical protein